MSPFERACRALVKQQSGSDDWDALDVELQDTIKAEVRAVLEAVREPSEGMAETGGFATSSPKDDEAAVWQAMIDTLLAE